MNSIGIILSSPVPIPALREFVLSLRGEWHDEYPEMVQGSFTCENAWVFLRGATTQCEDVQFIDESDRAKAIEQLGQVSAFLSVDFSKSQESQGTAEFIISELLKKWKGIRAARE